MVQTQNLWSWQSFVSTSKVLRYRTPPHFWSTQINIEANWGPWLNLLENRKFWNFKLYNVALPFRVILPGYLSNTIYLSDTRYAYNATKGNYFYFSIKKTLHFFVWCFLSAYVVIFPIRCLLVIAYQCGDKGLKEIEITRKEKKTPNK